MDDSRKPGNSSPTKYSWQNDEESGKSLGATGVFGTTPESNIDGDAGSVTQETQEENSGERRELLENPPHPVAPGVRERLQEPIVHKIVLGGGSAAAPSDLLERLRASSPAAKAATEPAAAEPVPGSWNPPSPAPFGPPLGQSSEGFTQMLRGWSGNPSPALPAEQPDLVERTAASSDSRLPRSEFGFTPLVKTENTDHRDERPDLQAPSPSVPPSDGTGGFTALLQGFSRNTPNLGEQPLGQNPGLNPPAPNVNTGIAPEYASGKDAPGTFTQLLSALNPETKDAALAEPVATNSRAANSEAPFNESTYGDGRPPILEDLSRRSLARREDPSGSSQLSNGITDWSRPMLPQQESSPGNGGLTQFLRILEKPGEGPEIPVAYPSAGPPASSPGSFFTETYKKLDEPAGPSSPEAPASYSQPSKVAFKQSSATPFAVGTFPYQELPAPVAPNLAAEPSEVTRIVDASKLREIQRLRASGGPPVDPVAQPLPAPVSAPMPVTPLGLQHPPAPAAAAWPQPQYTPPPMPAPAPVPAAAAPGALGKMQQYLPLLLIIIIFLLIVILVTVIFLLKH
jgi:hypothetical protein